MLACGTRMELGWELGSARVPRAPFGVSPNGKKTPKRPARRRAQPRRSRSPNCYRCCIPGSSIKKCFLQGNKLSALLPVRESRVIFGIEFLKKWEHSFAQGNLQLEFYEYSDHENLLENNLTPRRNVVCADARSSASWP